MSTPGDLEITLDLESVRRSAERVRETLTVLRRRFDLSPFEYSKRVRISPLEIPHSHPIITLNTFASDELGVLSTYLHEQMHWYLTWYGQTWPAPWRELTKALHARYPDAPADPPEAAPDAFSTFMHLIINWLEIEATARFIAREKVIAYARARPFYRWMYRIVIEDWEALGALYAAHKLLPQRYATEMSPDELRMAAALLEAPA
jgi:hypothetical protein